MNLFHYVNIQHKLKSKLARPVCTVYEVKIKMAAAKNFCVITWKSLFSGEIKLWWSLQGSTGANDQFSANEGETLLFSQWEKSCVVMLNATTLKQEVLEGKQRLWPSKYLPVQSYYFNFREILRDCWNNHKPTDLERNQIIMPAT